MNDICYLLVSQNNISISLVVSVKCVSSFSKFSHEQFT